MTKEKYEEIVANQMDDKYKKEKANFIISNNSTKAKTRKKLEETLKKILLTDL